jgi:hypothetical protein
MVFQAGNGDAAKNLNRESLVVWVSYLKHYPRPEFLSWQKVMTGRKSAVIS